MLAWACWLEGLVLVPLPTEWPTTILQDVVNTVAPQFVLTTVGAFPQLNDAGNPVVLIDPGTGGAAFGATVGAYGAGSSFAASGSANPPAWYTQSALVRRSKRLRPSMCVSSTRLYVQNGGPDSPTNAVLHEIVKSWKKVGLPLTDSPAKLVNVRPSTVTDAGHGTFAVGVVMSRVR